MAGMVGAPPAVSGTSAAAQVARAVSAVKRYTWLIIAIVAVGTAVGYSLTKVVQPKFTVSATIWVNRPNGTSGPISSPGLVTDALAWGELGRSFIVLDNVVAKLALYVTPRNDADTLIVRNFLPSDSLKPGKYLLNIEPSSRYSLVRKAEVRGDEDKIVERGTLGDSVGRSVGFLWQPTLASLGNRSSVEFTVLTPREAARVLNGRLVITGPSSLSNMMRLQLTGEQPGLLAATMNALVHEFVTQATLLKAQNLQAISDVVDEQLKRAAADLHSAEVAYQSFKVNTITKPNERTIVNAGVAWAESPVLTAYFNDNVAYKQVEHDRELLRSILDKAEQQRGRIDMEALRTLPVAFQANTELTGEITNLATMHASLRQLQRTYTDSYPPVLQLKKQIDTLESKTIPTLARGLLNQLSMEAADRKSRIEGASQELRQIPERTVEEQRRLREVQIQDRLYQDLQQRSEQARLARMSVLPEIQVLDSAVAPLRPTSDTTIGIFLVAIAGSIGVAILLAILLDRLDKRFRYPEQATNELGLDIMGAIPTLKNPRNSAARLQEATQLVESFRSLSLSLRSAFDGNGPMQLTVSSPGPGDGKSFISANLASALADGGYRTILVDGDIRRGALHSVFAPMTQDPGLLDYLAGDSTLAEVVRSTSHGNLFVLPCGKRRRHGPELLAGQGMAALVRDLGSQFDAVVIDSAPLGAGIDPFALGVASGAMLLVLRTGETDRRLAQSKLEVLDRLPVRVLGTVLNDIGENPQFKYYYYLEGYGSIEEATPEHAGSLSSGNGNGAGHK